LPKLMLPFNFAFGLWRRGIEETNVIKLQSPAQLSQRLRGFREKDAVIIHIELQRPAMGQESCRQEIQVGQEQFSVVKFGADEKTTAVIEHVKHGQIVRQLRKPLMRRGIQLPEFADFGALPTAHRRLRTLRWQWMSVVILNCPTTNLSPVEFERVQPSGLGSHEAVGTGR